MRSVSSSLTVTEETGVSDEEEGIILDREDNEDENEDQKRASNGAGRRRMIEFEQILLCLGGRLKIEDSDQMIKSIKKLFKRIEILELIERSGSNWKGFVLDGSSASRVT
ncbi:hypothetical protein BY996DRAFT_6575483 [Phakopsora pachyrhizi]|uniref:Uncharacterized protein n=1 Tax=Phakopsora pachyrhizi TaxID=170000 RepID=A0AAV0AUV6_PHAPC|nr:hypothetical protein BY996DRAFT_6575483 [Phakopsora pachyrhizi]CAH7672280.1 hypothetical protein PPACK8108_LOCUS7089 [Phakopsora pachyrhizi]